jgi:hypothetical protein
MESYEGGWRHLHGHWAEVCLGRGDARIAAFKANDHAANFGKIRGMAIVRKISLEINEIRYLSLQKK